MASGVAKPVCLVAFGNAAWHMKLLWEPESKSALSGCFECVPFIVLEDKTVVGDTSTHCLLFVLLLLLPFVVFLLEALSEKSSSIAFVATQVSLHSLTALPNASGSPDELGCCRIFFCDDLKGMLDAVVLDMSEFRIEG